MIPFQDYTLDDIADFRNGKGLPPSFYSANGTHPVWGANGQIARTDELLNPAPVIVIGRVGAYCGSIHLVNEPSWVSDNAIVATPKKGFDLRFLYYRLKSLGLARTAIGSAQPLITQGGLKVVDTCAPEDIAEQRAIAEILGSLDDKIELNRRMNGTLESLARAIFKAWFIDFEPVRAKAAGVTSFPGIPQNLFDQLPNKLTNSELGLIPEGWKVGRLDDAVVLQRGFDLPKRKRTPGSFPVVMASGIGDYHEEAKVKGPGVVTGRSGKLGEVFLLLSDFWPLNTVLWIKKFKASSPCHSYFLLKRIGLDIYNAGSAVPTLNRNHVHGLPVVLAPQPILNTYEQVAMTFFQQRDQNERESRTIAAIRDALLPKLISGGIRVGACDGGR